MPIRTSARTAYTVTRIRHGHVCTPLGQLLVAATDKGLCWIELGARDAKRAAAPPLARLADFAKRRFEGPELAADGGALAEIRMQLEEYAAGERRRFELPLDLAGTSFEKSVWRELRRVPFGRTTTYGELAQRLGSPGASRAVGRANGANPVPIVVPCHRVLAAGGALGGFSAGLEWKRALLAHEGTLLLG